MGKNWIPSAFLLCAFVVGLAACGDGAMTAVGMAAGWVGAAPDPRVAAIAPISAVTDGDLHQGTQTGPNAGFSREPLESIVVPTLLIGGAADVGAETLLEPYTTTCGPDVLSITEATGLTNLYVVSFFKRHLHGEAA
ncbi:MAG: hypothetical protein P8R42_05840 [Candidatus Binatia bacterium]|nr:hypothetical protein [Candidatus Binatia bacterium]